MVCYIKTLTINGGDTDMMLYAKKKNVKQSPLNYSDDIDSTL